MTSSGMPRIPVLAVVGVGLIGGSFAAALRQAGVVERVLGVGRHRDALTRALSLGLVDEIVTLEQAAGAADLILLATPVGSMAGILSRIRPLLSEEALITDAGSTKGGLVAAAAQALGPRIGQYVPAHPIAGGEQAGPEAAQASLFRGRHVVLTPTARTDTAAVGRITRVWEACGAHVMQMTPEAHDRVLASVSHLPHFLSSVFMWQIAMAEDSDLRLTLAGTGFRDVTRIAAGSSEVWRDIFLANRDAVLHELDALRDALDQAQQALQAGDGEALRSFLERAAVARRFWGSRSGFDD